MRPSPSPTRLVLLPRLDWIAGTAIPLPIKWHRYPTYVHDSEKKRNVFEITMYLKALINGEGIVKRFNIRVFERRARYFRNVTHVPNLFSQEDISIRCEAGLHAFRGHRVARDESIGSANVSICLTDVEPSLPNVSPPLRPPFRIPAIFPSTTRDCLSYPIEKLTIFDSFRENFNLKRLADNPPLHRYSMIRERERDEGENFNLAEPVEPELNLICPPPSIWIDRSIG